MKTLLFVDDEPKVLQGLQRQLRPMRNDWNMNFIEGGEKALAFMAANPVDIVISDMMMPVMDGSQLLTEVVKRHPRTVRIILSGHAEREAVLRLVGPAHQYLSKPCDADELRKAIARAFALRDLLGNERLKQLTTRIKNLPTLPALQNQLDRGVAQRFAVHGAHRRNHFPRHRHDRENFAARELGVFRPGPAHQQPGGRRDLSGAEHGPLAGAVGGNFFAI